MLTLQVVPLLCYCAGLSEGTFSLIFLDHAVLRLKDKKITALLSNASFFNCYEYIVFKIQKHLKYKTLKFCQ